MRGAQGICSSSTYKCSHNMNPYKGYEQRLQQASCYRLYESDRKWNLCNNKHSPLLLFFFSKSGVYRLKHQSHHQANTINLHTKQLYQMIEKLLSTDKLVSNRWLDKIILKIINFCCSVLYITTIICIIITINYSINNY